MHRLLSCLLAVSLLLGCVAARAGSPVRLAPDIRSIELADQFDVLEDPGERLTPAEVASAARAAAFHPLPPSHNNSINFGYSNSVWWLRLTLDASRLQQAQDWLLEVGFPSLDSVTLYVPDQKIWISQGDLQAFSTRQLPNHNFLFPLQLAPGQSHTIYLRVQSAGSLTIPLTLWHPEAFHYYNQDSYALLALYYGMLLALGLYNLLLFVSLRDRSYLAYVAFVACMAVGQLSLNGLGNQYLWPDSPRWGNAALTSGFAATGFFGALFTRRFLSTRRNTPRADRLIRLLAAAFAFAAVSPAFLPYQWAAILTSLIGAVFPVVAVTAAILCLRRGEPGAWCFLLAWTLLLVGVSVMALRNLGWLPTNLLTTNAMQIGSALEMLLLSFALADRIHVTRRDKDTAQAEAFATKEAMVDALRQSEQQLEQRVARRTAELAEANARLQESEHRLRQMARHDPLTGLANRHLLHERLEGALRQAEQSGRMLAVLLVDLDGFKPVNDTLGHAAGDRILVGIARLLNLTVRETDTVARLGGDEFVVMLEGLHSPAEARDIADKLIAAIADIQIPELPAALKVGASIGIACHWPTRARTTPHALLHEADQAMYCAKRNGRNRAHCVDSADPAPRL